MKKEQARVITNTESELYKLAQSNNSRSGLSSSLGDRASLGSYSVSLLNTGHPLPNIPEIMLRRLGSRKFKWAAKMDLTSGYHQVEMDPETSHFASFITSFGVFVPTRLMFGMKCTPAQI
jgi:hypothetical protein